MSWRLSSLRREVVLNLMSSGVLGFATIVVASAVLGATSFLELRQGADLRRFQASVERSGGYVAIATRPGQPLSAAQCSALQSLPAVRAAGAVRFAGTTTFASTRGELFQSAEVTEGLLEVWAPGLGVPPAPLQGAVVVGDALSRQVGVRGGSFLARPGKLPATVAAVLPAGGRNPGAAGWLLEVAPPGGTADECWVEFFPDTYDAGLQILPAWLTAESGDVAVRQYVRLDEFSRDPEAEFLARPQRWGWAAAGVLITVVLGLQGWFRRSELGLYLALGSPRVALLVMLQIEAVVVAAGALLAGFLWACAIQQALHASLRWDELVLAGRNSGGGALVAVLLAPVIMSLVARGSPAMLLKER